MWFHILPGELGKFGDSISPSFATAVEDSLPGVSHARVLKSKGFYCLYETRGTRAGSRQDAEKRGLRSRPALRRVQLRIHSDFLRNLQYRKTTFAKI